MDGESVRRDDVRGDIAQVQVGLGMTAARPGDDGPQDGSHFKSRYEP